MSKSNVMEKMIKPEKKSSKYKPTKEQEERVLEFAIINKCVVTPLGWHFALEAYNEFGHCVCDPQRPHCPCEQAPQEIAEKGHCRCSLFWKDYPTYMKAKNLYLFVCPDGMKRCQCCNGAGAVHYAPGVGARCGVCDGAGYVKAEG